MRTPALLFLALTLAGCAGRMESAVRRQAAADFACQESQIGLKQQATGGYIATYDAEGCGRQASYQGTCNLFMCRAYPQQVADANAPAPMPAGGDAYAAPSEPSEPSGASPAPSFDAPASSKPAPAPAGPKIVSVSIRSACSKTVKVFYGDKPKYGSGTTSSVSSNSVSSKQMQAGDMIWVVDDRDNGLGSVTIGETTRGVEIGSDCTSIRAN
jgi:hypothetical protein